MQAAAAIEEDGGAVCEVARLWVTEVIWVEREEHVSTCSVETEHLDALACNRCASWHTDAEANAFVVEGKKRKSEL